MSDVTHYLETQVQKAQRTLRIALIAMGIVLAVLFGYFQWLKSELAALITPESIAEIGIHQARAVLPEVSEALQANVRSEVPHVVRFALHQALDHVLPLLGQTFEQNLAEHVREVAALAHVEGRGALADVLTAYKAERIKQKARGPVTAQQIGSFVTARYGMALDDAAASALEERLEDTGGTLKQIDARLAALAAKRGSREDELGKRLITTWWTFLDRGQPRSPAALAKLAAEPAGKAPPQN